MFLDSINYRFYAFVNLEEGRRRKRVAFVSQVTRVFASLLRLISRSHRGSGALIEGILGGTERRIDLGTTEFLLVAFTS